MNFAYEAIQFDRLTKLIEFNTLLCVDTIKKELEEVVEKKKKKQYIPKLTFKDVVNTMKGMSSFSPGDRGHLAFPGCQVMSCWAAGWSMFAEIM